MDRQLHGPEHMPIQENASGLTKTSLILELYDIFKELLFAIAITVLLTRFVFIIPIVPSGSMIPTIQIDQRVLVDKMSVHIRPLERGEIVVFPCPDIPEDLYIKRVIGLPGDLVEIHDSTVFVNGSPLTEPYLPERMYQSNEVYSVPEGHIFVLGDNRNVSNDSRRWRTTHYVDMQDISGRGLAIVWPMQDMHWLE